MAGWDKLESLRARGMKFGTERTRALLDRLGAPDGRLKIVHIAGTNGKGSVAEFMTGILIAAGKRTGTFTTPLVYSYNDQFRVDGAPMDGARLEGYLRAAASAAEGTEATSFEVETAAALYAFAREGCEYAVVECGMGGDTDATNAISKKEVAVITSVSLEHTAYLGDTVTQICRRKAGIVKDCPVVIHPVQSEEGRAYLRHISGAILADTPVLAGNGFLYRGKRYELTALGAYQPANAACAIEAARLLNIGEDAVAAGIRRANPAGRLQLFQKKDRWYLLDGAHNPAAFAPLAAWLKEQQGRKTVIYGCLSDKDADGCLSALAGLADSLVVVSPRSPRAMAVERTLEIGRKYFPAARPSPDLSSALAGAGTELVVVCGSFTLLKEAKEWIENE